MPIDAVTLLSAVDRQALRYAHDLLEHPGLAARLTGLIGLPIEKAMDMLPERWAEAVAVSTRKSLETALRVALGTLDGRPRSRSRDLGHKFAVAATGVGGGAFGLAGLPVELPISTTLMLRSIADVARSEGEDLATPESQMACLEVFALGGRSGADDASDSSYFVVRAALARSISEAAAYIAQRGLVEEGAPVLVRFVAQVAARFGGTVVQKVAAQAVPIVGAAGGGTVNVLFMDHFQQMARGHFIVRRLERLYSPEVVREAYAAIASRA
ncbi:MAG: EcsC family protein [Vicinamibacterales bacterium]